MSDVDSLRYEPTDEQSVRVRQEIHERFTLPSVDFADWVLARGDWSGHKRVLDIGSSSGSYGRVIRQKYSEVEYYALDESRLALTQHLGRAASVVADFGRLPFSDTQFDTVVANHALFSVVDLDAAVREFKRVLTRDGILLTATSSVQTMPEFQALFRRVLLLLSSHVRPNSPYLLPPREVFTLENGVRRLSKHFFAVVRHDLPSALVFTESEPVMTYLNSLRSSREKLLPPDVTWEAVMDAMHDQVNRVITLQGELVVSKLSGVIVASERGGFIGEYCRILSEHADSR